MKSAILSVEEGDIQFARVVYVIDRLLLARRQSAAQFKLLPKPVETQIRRSRGNQGIVMAVVHTSGASIDGSAGKPPSQPQCGGNGAVWRDQITNWPCETAPAPITSPHHPHISSHPQRSDSPWLASP